MTRSWRSSRKVAGATDSTESRVGPDLSGPGRRPSLTPLTANMDHPLLLNFVTITIFSLMLSNGVNYSFQQLISLSRAFFEQLWWYDQVVFDASH